MTAQIQQAPAASELRPRILPAAMHELDRRIDNARECSAWLIEKGVKVISVVVKRGSAVVRVEASPLVTRLFANNCAWLKRRQVGAATIFTWFSVRNGARIEWEERQCMG